MSFVGVRIVTYNLDIITSIKVCGQTKKRVPATGEERVLRILSIAF
jgi:hypothetical protein